jgi:hypothetical protein
MARWLPSRTHGTRGRLGVVTAVLATLGVAQARGADDPLALARLLYNQHQFRAAISAADQARLTPAHADAADLVAARASLEQFRESGESNDLTSARERLRRMDPQKLSPRERVEFLIGLGEALFLDNAYGAAADVFDSVMKGPDLVAADARQEVLDWWATALDRDAKPRPEIERQSIYQRIRAKMEEELATHPGNGAALYWLAAAARGQGDLQAAWDAAEAGWVRAPLVSDRGTALRADLDQLVLQVIAPERARVTAQPPDSLRQDWEKFKEKWSK